MIAIGIATFACQRNRDTSLGPVRRPLLLRPVLGEEPLAAGKAVWLEEEAEDDGAVGRHRLVPVAGGPPDELTRSAHALVILERALEHERLLERGVLVQRHDGAG